MKWVALVRGLRFWNSLAGIGQTCCRRLIKSCGRQEEIVKEEDWHQIKCQCELLDERSERALWTESSDQVRQQMLSCWVNTTAERTAVRVGLPGRMSLPHDTKDFAWIAAKFLVPSATVTFGAPCLMDTSRSLSERWHCRGQEATWEKDRILVVVSGARASRDANKLVPGAFGIQMPTRGGLRGDWPPPLEFLQARAVCVGNFSFCHTVDC